MYVSRLPLPFAYIINTNRIELRLFHRFVQFLQCSCLGTARESFRPSVGAQTSDALPLQAFHEARALTGPYPHDDPPVKPNQLAIRFSQTPTDWGLPLAGLISRFPDFLTPKLSEPFGEPYDTCVYSFAVRVSVLFVAYRTILTRARRAAVALDWRACLRRRRTQVPWQVHAEGLLHTPCRGEHAVRPPRTSTPFPDICRCRVLTRSHRKNAPICPNSRSSERSSTSIYANWSLWGTQKGRRLFMWRLTGYAQGSRSGREYLNLEVLLRSIIHNASVRVFVLVMNACTIYIEILRFSYEILLFTLEVCTEPKIGKAH